VWGSPPVPARPEERLRPKGPAPGWAARCACAGSLAGAGGEPALAARGWEGPCRAQRVGVQAPRRRSQAPLESQTPLEKWRIQPRLLPQAPAPLGRPRHVLAAGDCSGCAPQEGVGTLGCRNAATQQVRMTESKRSRQKLRAAGSIPATSMHAHAPANHAWEAWRAPRSDCQAWPGTSPQELQVLTASYAARSTIRHTLSWHLWVGRTHAHSKVLYFRRCHRAPTPKSAPW